MKAAKKTIKKFEPDLSRYKLTEMELDRLSFRGVISPEQRDILIQASKLRVPNYYASSRFQIALNRRGTIILNSINFYGGEDFGEPYHFLGEITHTTTKSVFRRYTRQNGIALHPFKK